MPNNGQLLEPTTDPADYGWDWLVFKCGSVASVTTDDAGASYGHGATAQTDYCEDAVERLLGITLEVQSDWDGAAGSWSATYDGPAGPITTGGPTYEADVSIEVRIPDVLLYSRLTGSLLTLDTGTAELWVNGSYYSDIASFSDTSDGVGPHYIKQIGIPLAISGTCSVDSTVFPTDPVDDEGNIIEGGLPSGFAYAPCAPDPGDDEMTSEITATAYGGWRFSVGGSWYDLPVKVTVPATASSGPFGLTNSGILTSTRTWGNHVSSRDYRHYLFHYEGRENPTSTYVNVYCDGVLKRTDTNASSGSSCIDDCTGLPGPYYRDLYSVAYETEFQYGSVRLIPNLERAIVRLEDDYASNLYRYPFPSVDSALSFTYRDGGSTGSDVTTTEVYPSLSEFLAVVKDGAHDYEEPFDGDVLCEVYTQRTQGNHVGYTAYYTSVCTCPWDWFVLGASPCVFPELIGFDCGAVWPSSDDPVIQTDAAEYQFPSAVEDSSPGSIYIGGPMYHQDALTRYLATWCHPIWSMYYWTIEPWKVDGVLLWWRAYAGPIREQWFGNSSLPVDERTNQRNHIIATFTEEENGHTPFLDQYTAPASGDRDANGLRWIGMSRFKVAEYTMPVDITLSTSDPCEWAARVQSGTDDCSVELGAGGITLDDFAVSTAQVDCSLVNWDTSPFLLLALFQAVTLDWELTNVSSMEVVLVGYDGAETPLMTSPSRVDVKDLSIEQTKYAGTWAIDNGYGAVSDTGTDTLSAGMSASTMTDYPSRAMAMQLGLGRSWRYLRFRVTPIDTGQPVVVSWPYFEFPTVAPTTFWESGQCAAILFPDGPGIRWGAILSYVPGLGFFDPPLTSGLGSVSTMIDAKVFGHRIWQGDGGASIETTITGELGDIVDSLEGPASVSVVDKFSLAVPLPDVGGGTWDRKIRIAMANSFAEVPPLCCFPARKRDTSTWLATGDYWAGVYDQSQLQREIVSSAADGGAVYIEDGTVDAPVGAELLSGVPLGWHVWQYAPALDNTEAGWRIVSGSKRIATVRPWHGFYCLVGDLLTDTGTAWVSYHVSASRRHAVAKGLADDSVYVGVSASGPSLDVAFADAGFDGEAGCIRWAAGGKLYLWTVLSGAVEQRTSDDEGGIWSVATSIGSGTQVCAVVTPQRVRYIYRVDGTAITVQARDADDNLIISDTAAVASGVDDAPIDCDYRPLGGGKFEIVLWYISGGTLTEKYSNDGITFS